MITGAAKIAAVIGDPIAHSRSPQLHGYWLKEHKIDGVVVPLKISSPQLASCIEAMRKMGFRGSNVTIPHKEALLDICTSITDQVKAVGAANLIVFDGETTCGYNSDVFGFTENLNAGVPDWPKDRCAMVLGAGGAARAVICGLIQEDLREIVIVNRTAERAEKLIADFAMPFRNVKLRFCSYDNAVEVMAKCGVLINTTSLGMSGQPPLDLAIDNLPGDAVVNDIVYTPLNTDLLQRAAQRGLRTVDGLGMLLHQARPAFEHWFGVDPQVTDDLRKFVLST